ncbi:MAG: tRNA pseudouridine(13) synthase TruD [Deferrisomatales bacterium]|nr:tRNA pseudouridine(13) synthase TruD [Deferrisomatales bacterium]
MSCSEGLGRCRLGASPYTDFDYPYLWTSEAAGGRWEPSPETFQVREVPLYPFSGDGEHAALVVEKAGVTTRDLALAAAGRLGVPPAAVGYAGMKDKACVSVQGFTVTGVDEGGAAAAFEAAGARVLSTARHRNKLRLGHLAGNAFRARLSGADPGMAAAVLEALGRTGFPNYFGPQRFGARGDNPVQGVAVLQGRRRVGRWKRDLLVSALQAFVCNEVLARRVEEGTVGVALEGDVLRREDSGGLFLCADPAVDSERAAAFQVSPTGPLHGRKMVRPAGSPGASEAAVLEALGLAEELFARETGTRRPLRAPLRDWGVEAEEGAGCWVSFTCPAGAFATSVIREVLGPRAGSG